MIVIAAIKNWFSGFSHNQWAAGVAALSAAFSAVAAMISMFVAFGQERATYHSALYGKQIEEIVAFDHSFRDLLKNVETDTTPSDDVKMQFTLIYGALILVSPPQAARPVNELVTQIVADRSHDKHKAGAQESKRLERLLISYQNCAQLQLSTGHDLNGDDLVNCFAERAKPDLRPEPQSQDSKSP